MGMWDRPSAAIPGWPAVDFAPRRRSRLPVQAIPQHRGCKRVKEWRIAVRLRAGGRCERCGGPGSEAHHVKPWHSHPDKRVDLTNGRWLCPACHKLEERLAC